MVLGHEALGRGLDHEGRTFTNGISALRTQAIESYPTLFQHVRTCEEMAIYELGSRFSPDTDRLTP